MRISIRAASKRDMNDILRLCLKLAHYEGKLIGREPDENSIRARVVHDLLHNDGCAYYLAFVEEEIAGILKVSAKDGNRAKISQTYVVGAHRCKGIMTALFAKALEWAKSRNIASLYLTVVCKNTYALSFWEKFGFRVDCAKGKNLLIMRRDVQPAIIS